MHGKQNCFFIWLTGEVSHTEREFGIYNFDILKPLENLHSIIGSIENVKGREVNF